MLTVRGGHGVRPFCLTLTTEGQSVLEEAPQVLDPIDYRCGTSHPLITAESKKRTCECRTGNSGNTSQKISAIERHERTPGRNVKVALVYWLNF